jgi:hypothetical protein
MGVLVAIVFGVLGLAVTLWLALRQPTNVNANVNSNSHASANLAVTNSNDLRSMTPSPKPSEPPRRQSPEPTPPRSSVSNLQSPERPRTVESDEYTPVDNDIGKQKNNDFFEVTVENARISTDRIGFDNCRLQVPAGQKAVLIRFSIRWAPSKSLTGPEQFALGRVTSTDFVLIDDRNRRVDTACPYAVFLISQVGRSANTRTLAYLVNVDTHRLMFRFQKAGGGQPITFDISGLN